jgi:hypothetical protein
MATLFFYVAVTFSRSFLHNSSGTCLPPLQAHLPEMVNPLYGMLCSVLR